MENGDGRQESCEISVDDPQDGHQESCEIQDLSLPKCTSTPQDEQDARSYLLRYRGDLYRAARNGNWSDAEKILIGNPGACITEGSETLLHISALNGNVEFVRTLVPLMNNQALEKLNEAGNTALCLAAVTGNVEIADAMINKYPELSRIHGYGATEPVMMAAKLGNGPMVEYLRLKSPGGWTHEEDIKLLNECISSDSFDAAWKLVRHEQELAASATVWYTIATVWDTLARKPMAVKSKKGKLNKFIDSCFLMEKADDQNSLKFQAYDMLKYMFDTAYNNDTGISIMFERAPKYLFDAAKQGNLELFKLLLDYFPELVWAPNDRTLSLFHVAVENRHESIFAQLCVMDEVKRLVTLYIDEKTGDNMLHLAARLAPKDKLNSVSGAAFQMQQAILWYQAVEKIVPPSYRNMPNNEEKTPSDIFDKEHESLLKKGERWMKGTAKSCMLVAALIATVIFAAAFTEPGGNNNKGYPCLLNKIFFQFFSISEVIGLFSSSTSILVFLSILTERINKYSFQHSLPCKLFIGLAMLFVSIASMVIAFSTSILLSYQHASRGIPVLLIIFPCVPLVFIFLMYRLFVDIVHSTFVSGFMSGSGI